MITAEVWWEQHIDEFLTDVSELIRIPSVSIYNPESKREPYGRACADVLKKAEEMVHSYGFECENQENQCLLLRWKGSEKSQFGIFSHLDVVPEGDGWNYSPYEPVVKDDIIIGRGIRDNKGPAVMVLYALRYLKEIGFSPRHEIIQFFGVNEESGMRDAEYFTAHNPMPAFSLVPDAAFPVCYAEKGIAEVDAYLQIGESSEILSWKSGIISNMVPALCEAVLDSEHNTEILASLKGNPKIEAEIKGGRLHILSHGRAAHAASPKLGESAQNILCQALLDTGLLKDPDKKLMTTILALLADYNGEGIGIPYWDFLIGKLTHVGGLSDYTRGSLFHQNINIRYNITADCDEMFGEMEKRLASFGMTMKVARNGKPMYVDPTSPLVTKLTEISNRVNGSDRKPYTQGGCTYAGKLENAVGFGAGIIGAERLMEEGHGGAHQPDEYLEIETLRKGFFTYIEAIQEMDRS